MVAFKRKPVTVEEVYLAAKRNCDNLIQQIANTGHLELSRILRDRVMAQALAMLEGDCMIAACGEADANFRVPYRLVHDEMERAMLKSTRKLAEQREILEGTTPSARTAALNAAARSGGQKP